MQLQITTDYAIRIIEYLHQHRDQLSTAMHMSQKLGITYQYFMKVINRLKQAGYVQSVQGCSGGYKIAAIAEDATLYDIITVMEGEIVVNRCLREDGFCSRNATSYCKVHKALAAVQAELIAMFKSKRLLDIV